MKFDFNYYFTDLDGKEILDGDGTKLHAGKSIAKLLMQSTDSADLAERMDWAQQLHKGIIDLDNAGQEKFKSIVLQLPNLWAVIRMKLINTITQQQKK